MRGKIKMLIFLVVLSAMLFAYGWMAQQARILEEDCAQLELEIRLLQSENATLREQQTELNRRMQDWLDAWEVDVWESSAYAPLDPRAVGGMCYVGNPAITASGAKVVPGLTAAAGPDVPFGALVRVEGAGWRQVTDRGGRIGSRCIDIAVQTQEEALRWGRQIVRVVVQR